MADCCTFDGISGHCEDNTVWCCCANCGKDVIASAIEYKEAEKLRDELNLQSLFSFCESCGMDLLTNGVLEQVETIFWKEKIVGKNLLAVKIDKEKDIHLSMIGNK